MIRFCIKNGDDVATTEWEDELIRVGTGVHTAVARMTELRKQHGKDARISIERTTSLEERDRRQVRFKIAMANNETRYSATFPIAEQGMRMADMQAKFPKAEVVPEVISG